MTTGCCNIRRRRYFSDSYCDLTSPSYYRALLAEFLGTMVLVVVGCGTCLGRDWESYTPTIVQISLAFGLAVAVVVWCIGHVSGGHINPAVTLAMLMTRKISLLRSLTYIVAQCSGATVGSAFLAGLTPTDVRESLGMPSINPSITTIEGFGVELIITFVLVMTVFAACDENRKDLAGNRPLAIGLSVTLCHLFAIKYTGSSMNPARSFGPALLTSSWSRDYWVYWCGPILGGILAGLIYELIFASDSSLEKARQFIQATSIEGVQSRNGQYTLQDIEEQDHKHLEVVVKKKDGGSIRDEMALKEDMV